MSLVELISYDPTTVGAMDVKELLVQLVARSDLTQPKREGEVRSSEASSALKAKSLTFLAKINTLGLPELSKDLTEIISFFFSPDGGYTIGEVPPVPAPTEVIE